MKGRIYQWLVLLGLITIFLIMARAVWRLWEKNNLAENNLVSSVSHLEQLISRKEMLEKKLTKIETNRGIEEEIRANFSVVKPGEKVINIIEEGKATSTATSVPDRHWWQIF